MRRIFRDNGLTIVLTALFLIFWVGQSVAGHRHHNEEQREHGQSEVSFGSYLTSAHFWEATAENWESEFLQMFGYVILTAFLFQRGSAESRDPDKREAVVRHPRSDRAKPDAPGPVRKGGFILKLYENSLSLAFLLFFLISIALHAAAGAAEYNEEQSEHGEVGNLSVLQYAATSRFWFESFQNWQSEFLSIASMVVLSIFLRQRGSPESKPVSSPHSETGG
jgi:preprotein translocase subunit SecG